MLGYYLHLALRSLRRNVVLTVLMVAAIGVGIGASMTALTAFRAMSDDPIPRKSKQLYVAQIDVWGPNKPGEQSEDQLNEQLSYIDASALMNAHGAPRQSALYTAILPVRPANPRVKPFKAVVRAVYADFFPMMDVPFKFGGAWTSLDDQNRTPVVVIARKLNDKLFGGINSIGKTIDLDNQAYTVVGVVDDWRVTPRFYDLHIVPFGELDEMFLPFRRAIARQMTPMGSVSCKDDIPSGFAARLESSCLWIELWAELPTAQDAARYRTFLNNYAAEQQRVGRFHWAPHTQLRDVMQWLRYRHVVPGELRILVLVSFGFLLVCLLNAMGLMLAKIMGRAADISVRRALGASRRAIFAQCLVETGVVGLLGGIAGLAFTALGLLAMRSLLSKKFVGLAHLDLTVTAIEVLLAIVVTAIAGLYPTWRAAQMQPAWQLKVQ